MTSRQRFAAHGALASAVTTLVAAISHTLGGGAAPAPMLVIGMAALLVGPAALLMGRGPRLTRIVLTTVVAQVAFHAAFDALGGPVAGSSPAGGGHHHHHGLDLAALAGTAPSSSEGSGMLAAHVCAALATIGILAYGERVIRRGASWIRAAALALVSRPHLPDAPRLIALTRPRLRAAERVVAGIRVRGPPVVSF
ncbi:hypothetical protein [Microbacterium sp. G2-8]|uniref:hypothetical protein n=1 Tax=Microbacterium sp. G2-8 TaxID=2842454 RepID=UPI001C89164D|nr:hypothetical protein [Microbacterium sp. G2-8]